MAGPSGARRAGAVTVVAELLVTAGVLLALFVFYLLFWTGLATGRVQAQAADDLRAAWAAGAMLADGSAPGSPDAAGSLPGAPGDGAGAGAAIREGAPVAFLSAPGANIDELVAFEGVDMSTLAGGPGHYPGTALPGEAGNASFAAHRDGNGAPFDDLDRLGTCDDITVETADAVFRYKVLPVDGKAGAGEAFDCVPEGTEVPAIPGRHVVTPDRVDVVGKQGPARLLTFTTCHPKWSNSHRLIVHAVLAGVDEKGRG